MSSQPLCSISLSTREHFVRREIVHQPPLAPVEATALPVDHRSIIV